MGLLKSIMLHDASARICENDKEHKHSDQDVSQDESRDRNLEGLS